MKKEKKNGRKGLFFLFLFSCSAIFLRAFLFRVFPTLSHLLHYLRAWNRLYTSRPSDHDATYLSLRSSAMRRKQNFFLQFSRLIFSFTGHLEGFILAGKVLGKAFRILGLDERKGRWVVEQDFHGNFWVSVKCFFSFFSGVLY